MTRFFPGVISLREQSLKILHNYLCLKVEDVEEDSGEEILLETEEEEVVDQNFNRNLTQMRFYPVM